MSKSYIWEEVIETTDRWKFFEVITPLFFNALTALIKMERLERGMFTSKIDNITYKFTIRKQYGLTYTLWKDGTQHASPSFKKNNPHWCVPKQPAME